MKESDWMNTFFSDSQTFFDFLQKQNCQFSTSGLFLIEPNLSWHLLWSTFDNNYVNTSNIQSTRDIQCICVQIFSLKTYFWGSTLEKISHIRTFRKERIRIFGLYVLKCFLSFLERWHWHFKSFSFHHNVVKAL